MTEPQEPKKVYLILKNNSEGEAHPIRVALDYNSALKFIQARVSELNSWNIKFRESPVRHEFRPRLKQTLSIEEIDLVQEDKPPTNRVWFVKVNYTKEYCYIYKFPKEEEHITFFPNTLDNIPTSEYRYRDDEGGAYVFSKGSLEHAFQLAERYLKDLGKEFTYKTGNYCF